MKTTAFTHEQLAKLTGTNQIESSLKKWLISLSVEERIAFLSELWPTNFRLALKLTQAAQLPRKETEKFFRHLLRESHHNAAQEIIKRFTPMLGEKKFWRIAAQEEITPAMRDFLTITGVVGSIWKSPVKLILYRHRTLKNNVPMQPIPRGGDRTNTRSRPKL